MVASVFIRKVIMHEDEIILPRELTYSLLKSYYFASKHKDNNM